MNENQITIPLYEYKEMLKATEQLKAVKRLIERESYVSVGTIKAIFGIEENQGKGEKK